MNVTHRLGFLARCPVTSGWDWYECEVTTDRLIPVEDIKKLTDSYSKTEIYQENLCQELANKLGAQVTLRGEHSSVKTVVTCEPQTTKI